MFNKEEEGKYTSSKTSILSILEDDVNIKAEASKVSCTYPEDIKVTVKASFQFIKDNPIIVNDNVSEVYITMAAFLKGDESEEENNFNYAITAISGVVKEVYDSYVVLEGKNDVGVTFDIKVIYEKILYFGHSTIRENFESYVNFINENASLCKDCYSQGYNLLVRLAKILGRNEPKERDFVFILGGVLTRKIEASNISIVRNLVLVDEIFVNPIISINGFSQVPNEK